MSLVENISKVQAAERQLRLAIQLFFERRDPVAIETLAYAASTVLRDIGGHRGVEAPLRDSEIIRPERKTEWISALNRAANFFKHADKDPDGTLEFRTDVVPLTILEAADMLGRVAHRWVPETLVFFSWFVRKHPDLLRPDAVTPEIAAALASDVDLDDFDTLREAFQKLCKSEKAGRWPPGEPAA